MSDKENNPVVDCAVKIAVRERPFNADELKSQMPNGIEHHESNENIIIVENRPFVFDYVFGPESSQVAIYQALVEPLVEKMLAGFHCTVLAYGQSGNGKTYTMGLHSNANEDEQRAGIIVRTLRAINERIQTEDVSNVKLQVSFIEIYNEKVYDLLSDNQSEPISVKGNFKNFARRDMKCESDAQLILAEAAQKRHFRPTKINSSSSRSHAVFTIYARIQNSDMCTINSEFNLVDLAGAEGVRRTGHHGVALAEGVNINQGLLSVGRVLQSITKGDKVIPYRESTLTRVLQESLNSNCYLTLLACVSPSLLDTKETLNTLRFAENVGTLKNDPKINVIINEITMARRKTPTKQVFTPFSNKKISESRFNFQTLKKRSLHFPAPGTARKISKIVAEPLAESTIRRTITNPVVDHSVRESEFSMFGPNISTSTFLQPNLNETNFSPVIRRYMNNFESKIEAKLTSAFEEMAKTIMETTLMAANATKRRSSTPISKEISSKRLKVDDSFGFLKTEIRNIIRNELEPLKIAENDQNLFKKPVTPTLTNEEVPELNQKDQTFNLTDNNDDITEGQALRISTPIKKTNKHNILPSRRSKRIFANESRKLFETTEIQQNVVVKTTKPKGFIKNEYLAQYFRKSFAETEAKAADAGVKSKKSSSKKSHTQEILHLLNHGNLKELQILRQIGLKTAFQIMTFRTTNGHFKSFKDLSKLNWTDKKLEKFLKENHLSTK